MPGTLILSECTRCGETFPRLKTYLQQPARTGRSKKEDAHEQEAAGEGCAEDKRQTDDTVAVTIIGATTE